jgi:predicted AlkP superfamily phosphohydrolase/phosphomutase
MQPLLVIGLDAMDAQIVDELIARGEMPHLANLAQTGVSGPVEATCMSTLPGAIWTDLGTGTAVQHHGDFFPVKLHTGEQALRPIDPTQLLDDYYWSIAALAGRKVIAVDQPLVPPFTPTSDMILVSEWQVHDQLWGRGTYPPELLSELEAKFGRRPLDRCDTAHDYTGDGYRRLSERIVNELSIKTDMAVDLMGQDWDLFTIAYSDGHCAGHQMFHLHEASARKDAVGQSDSSPISATYRAIDHAIGRLLDAAPPDTGILVFTSHGMGPYIGGPQLIPVVLRALDLGDPRRVPNRLRSLIPQKTIQGLFRVAPITRKTLERLGVLGRSFSSDVYAMAVSNNRVGAVRLNLAGREPSGLVEKRNAPMILERIEAELVGLRLPESDEHIVEQVTRTEDLYGEDRHPDLPDLLVVFRRDLGELTRAVGPTIGLIEATSKRPDYRRTGDHTDVSRVWIRHPRVDRLNGTPRSVDVAPTILDLLDVQRPERIDGRSFCS